MEQKSLSKWLKVIIIGIGICGLIVYAYLIPVLGKDIMGDNFYPWMIFLWLTAIPCYGVLILAWRIATNIGNDKSFSMDNANSLKYISILAAGDSTFFFVVNVVYLILDINSFEILLISLLIDFVGIAVSVAAAALSHLVRKAADLQEQSDYTI